MHRIDYYFPKTRKGSRSGNCIICGVWIHGAGHSKSQHLRVCYPAGAKLVYEANRRAHAKIKARKAAVVAQAALLAQQSLQRSAQQQIPVAPNQTWNMNYNQPFFFPFYDFHQGQTIAPVYPMPLAPPPNDEDDN